MRGTKAYPVGAGTYSKHPDRYASDGPRLAWATKGPWVIADHRPYVDLTSGMGAVILGHRHPDVDAAVIDQLSFGVAYPLPTALEGAVAERLLCMLTWERAESVRFGKNGADVTTTAVRLARAVTGKRKILYLDYHGHHDWCMTEPPWNAGVRNAAYSSVRVNGDGREPTARNIELIEAYWPLVNDDVAAIILEPVPSNTGEVAPPEFWSGLRKLCDQRGCLLILDEMVSGFRAAPGGGAELFGIEPDIACYGKAMANGLPLSAIVGPYEYMRRYEEDVFFSLTHAGEALSLAAALETLRLIYDGDALGRIGELGKEIAQVCHVKQPRYGYPQRLLFDTSEADRKQLLDLGLLCAGYANLTLAHAQEETARALILDGLGQVFG